MRKVESKTEGCGFENSDIKIPVFRSKKRRSLKHEKMFDERILEPAPQADSPGVPEFETTEAPGLKPSTSFDAWLLFQGKAENILSAYSHYHEALVQGPELIFSFLRSEADRSFIELFEQALKCKLQAIYSGREIKGKNFSELGSDECKDVVKTKFQPFKVLNDEPLLLTIDLSWFDVREEKKSDTRLKDLKGLFSGKGFKGTLNKFFSRDEGTILLFISGEIDSFRDLLYELSKTESGNMIIMSYDKATKTNN